MAQNDIIVPKEGAGGVLSEIALAASDLKLGTTSGLPIKTGTNGVLEAGAFGTSAGQFCEGNDARLSDARTPSSTLAHKTSHAVGGTDALSAADIGAAATSHTHAAADITSGTLTHERGGLEADVSAYNGLVKIASGSTSAVTVTSAGEALLDDADAAAQRTTLGLGTAAVEATTAFAASGSITSSGLTQSTARILGRTTASSGSIEEITIGSGLSLSAGELSANFAAPPAIGNTTAAAGTFTTLTGSTQIVGPQGSSAGTDAAPALSLGASGTGLFVSSGQLAFAQAGALRGYFDNSGRLLIHGVGGFGFTFNDQPILMQRNVTLVTDGVNGALAQREGTQAQQFRLYGTFTSATNYQRMTVRSVKTTLSALSGASVATTGTFIPDGAVVVGVTTRVATAVTGADGYQIGDGTDADRWGDITGTVIGTTSDNANWTAGTIECFTAGGEVTLTAKTANFTAGAIEICVFYLAGQAD